MPSPAVLKPLPTPATYKPYWRPLGVLHAPRLLGAPLIHVERPGRRAEMLIGWGRKRSGLRAVAAAEASGRPWLLAEDGFLRSIGLGKDDAALSIVVDDLGIYYDCSGPSRLEVLAALDRSPAELERARAFAAGWRAGRVSKYNAAREAPLAGLDDYVLAIDQTAADSSIVYGGADGRTFQRMLEAALDEHPGARIVLKVHPDVIAGRKQGNFAALTAGAADRVTLLASNAHPPSLVAPARAVYVVTSQMGFEALLWQRPVRCFGLPFYAGWGLTDDDQAAPPRRRPIAFEQLVHAALIDYPRYLDPETLERCEPERLLHWMSLQRHERERRPPVVHAVGFRGWKRPIARAYFAGSRLQFLGTPRDAAVPAGEAVAAWGVEAEAVAALRRGPGDATAAGPVLRVEDGFLRSVGLGADFTRPLSWVLDRRGIYYDPSQPSDLEHLLLAHPFDDALRARAAALRARLVAAGLTKYNVGRGRWQRPAGGRPVVLVPGQVESDASIARGAGSVRTNLALLQAVRQARPDAWLVYKPHPDVIAGLRRDDRDARALRAACDDWVEDVPMHLLLAQVDALHTMTSLAGFEALLRGLPVVCHGAPFYAGWGLTDDRVTLPRRTRRLALDELVAGALILYPSYVSRVTGHYTTPERAIDELEAWRQQPGRTPGPLRRLLRPLVSRWLGWRGL